MTIANQRGGYADEKFANNQRDASGSGWTLCSALSSVVLIAAALMVFWRVPTTPGENWLIVAAVAAALGGCLTLRYVINRRRTKEFAQSGRGSI